MHSFESDKSKIVYHYTSIDALISILQKDRITLRATNCMYLNDSNEILEGINAVKRVDDQYIINKETFNDHFITSFSTNSDDLSMWGMYAANGNGVAIGLKLTDIQNHYNNSMRCTYGAEESDRVLRGFLSVLKTGSSVFMPYNGEKSKIVQHSEEEISQRIIQQLIFSCLTTKNISYKFESEIRSVIDNNVIKKEVLYRNKNGIIVPYLNIDLSKETVSEIIIGPTNKQDLSHQSISYFLKTNGYNDVEIKHSSIPYRG